MSKDFRKDVFDKVALTDMAEDTNQEKLLWGLYMLHRKVERMESALRENNIELARDTQPDNELGGDFIRFKGYIIGNLHLMDK